MTNKYELVSKKKMGNLYLAEIMQTDCLQMLDDY